MTKNILTINAMWSMKLYVSGLPQGFDENNIASSWSFIADYKRRKNVELVRFMLFV